MRPVDVPPADEVTRPWWDATRAHRLTVQRCAGCGSSQHPPRAICIHCGDTERLGFADSAGVGTVDTFTAVWRAPRPDLDAPYVVARVRLHEGVLLVTRLEGRAVDGWRIGDRVGVAWVDLADGRALPIFTPQEPEQARA